MEETVHAPHQVSSPPSRSTSRSGAVIMASWPVLISTSRIPWTRARSRLGCNPGNTGYVHWT